MKFPTGKAPSCAVDEYIGSDFDAVTAVAENIQTIKELSSAADGLDDIATNLSDLLKLANNLEEYQVSEKVVLAENQDLVIFNKVVMYAVSLYISGPLVDRGLLFKGKDYDVLSSDTIVLKRTYGAGTELEAVQTITAESSNQIIYSDKTVFNRPVVPFKIGSVLKNQVIWGETLKPLLIYATGQYVPTKSLTIEHTINSLDVTDLGEGKIQISTDKGPLVLDGKAGRAWTQEQIMRGYKQSINKLLTEAPKEWKAHTVISSITHRVMVDGLEYIPLNVPFTTAATWDADKSNWDLILGRKPITAKPVGVSLDTKGHHTVIVSADSPTNVVSILGTPKYHKVLLVPTDSNITLVHSNSRIRLESKTTLQLTPECVYEFYVDHEGIVRQSK